MHGNDKHQIQGGGYMGHKEEMRSWDWGRDTPGPAIVSSMPYFFQNTRVAKSRFTVPFFCINKAFFF